MMYHPDNLTDQDKAPEILEQKAETIPEQIYITTIIVKKAYRRQGIDTVYFYCGV